MFRRGTALSWSVVIGTSALCLACSRAPSAPSPSQPNATEPPPANAGGASVAVAFVGPSGCSPLPTRPCELTVSALATDPDGGPITYRWSGCASGSAPRAQCQVATLGDVTASVEVTDAQGLAATAEVTGTGTNRPPEFGIGYTWVAPSGGSVEFLGWVRDPDEGYLWGSRYCVSAEASGACTRASLRCPSSGPELIVLRSAPSGTCEISLEVKDSWDDVGAWLVTFDINNPSKTQIVPKGH